MSQRVNEQLPDDKALLAFQNKKPRRNRDPQNIDGAPIETPPPAPPAVVPNQADEPEPEQAPEPEADEPEPEAEPEAEEPEPEAEPEAEEPPQGPEPDPAAPPAGASEAEGDASNTSEEEGSGEVVTASVEVVVHRVDVSPSHSVLPVGLQPDSVIRVVVPDLGPTGVRAGQCTVMISADVRERFGHYQTVKRMETGREPANALVVRRAFLNAKRNDLFRPILAKIFHEATAVDEEDYDEDGMLGEVINRRATRGRRRTGAGQQSFRPSEQELATYDAYSSAYGFPDRSAFMDGVLDAFLPQLPAKRRR